MSGQKRSGEDASGSDAKKLNTQFTKEDIRSFFSPVVWDEKFQNELRLQIEKSQPYRWGTITSLMDDTLLRNVRNEVLHEIAFTKKETDIYKVYQSGDLANLSGLNWDDLSRLPSLYKLRAGIYSEEFRDFVSKVTGCGKLSGIKTDMSINTYTNGCHLLTHDDVIGSRRVSFILYLPDPDKVWKPSFGGSLRLFEAIVPNVPSTDFYCKLTPQFNQIAFFTVQPGLSFHDVEEVRVDKQRLSIQGWFHIPQPGEDGFIPGEQEETEARSTLQQLQSKELQEYDFPKPFRNDFTAGEIKMYEGVSGFSQDEREYLQKYINPAYLGDELLRTLCERFEEDNVIELRNFLQGSVADKLHQVIRRTEVDTQAPQTSREVQFPWKVAVPPHKQRYMYIDGTSELALTEASIKHANRIGPQQLPNFELLAQTGLSATDAALVEVTSFLKSVAFRKWLASLTQLVPTSDQVLVRRFRPGHDFVLATATDKRLAREHLHEANVLLEATLGLTPTAQNPRNWELGEFGGYEVCMALDNDDGDFEDDDPAIYRPSDPSDPSDDSVLYASQCAWNSLSLMVRDPSVLKFIKYVSASARGSRWDVSCQWNVKQR